MIILGNKWPPNMVPYNKNIYSRAYGFMSWLSFSWCSLSSTGHFCFKLWLAWAWVQIEPCLLHISLILFKPVAIGPSSCHGECQGHRHQVQLCITVKPFAHITSTNISLTKSGNLVKSNISGLGCILCPQWENTNCIIHYQGQRNWDQF